MKNGWSLRMIIDRRYRQMVMGNFYGELLKIAKKQGYSDAWVRDIYKRRFGVAPPTTAAFEVEQ